MFIIYHNKDLFNVVFFLVSKLIKVGVFEAGEAGAQ